MQLQISRMLPAVLAPLSRESDIWEVERSFQKGERVFIQAPSGTGKTTLINLLYGLRRDWSGTVLWGETDLKSATTEELAGLRAGPVSMVFQDLRLFPELTLVENLQVKSALGSPVSAAQIEDWISRLGLSHRRNALAATLSYGERQRTAILRALLQPFNWLLLDEPFSHLDSANTTAAAGLIQEVCNARGAGFLYADLDDNAHFRYTQKLRL